jgi:glycosyltransferase involved in cell wall biosynthesis
MTMRVVSAILFSPRGGSAHVARALARCLRTLDFSVTLLSGSRGGDRDVGDAARFYGDVHAVDFGPALRSGDPVRYEGPPGTAPLHPSYEDRPGAPDRVFAVLDDLDYERQVRAWARELERAGAADADVLQLHHLTPINEAAERVAPAVPVVGHLHGTELLMLEHIAAGPPAHWTHAERWAERMRAWARRCARVVVVPAGVERAVELLGLERARIVPLPNGADTELFRPRRIDRARFWRQLLVEDPQGWLPGEGPGSARYNRDEVERLAGGTVLLYVGRFTAVKRVDRLIEAFGRARERVDAPAGLVLVGGHPGEWEGEHPADTASRLGVPDVFLAGWHAQEELPRCFAAADAVAITSQREQFGQVVVEGMACGLPVIAVRSLGPASIVEDGRTGWLVATGDEAALAEAMVEALSDPRERRRRGARARQAAVERFSWSSIAGQLGTVLAEVVGTSRRGEDRLREPEAQSGGKR